MYFTYHNVFVPMVIQEGFLELLKPFFHPFFVLQEVHKLYGLGKVDEAVLFPSHPANGGAQKGVL